MEDIEKLVDEVLSNTCDAYESEVEIKCPKCGGKEFKLLCNHAVVQYSANTHTEELLDFDVDVVECANCGCTIEDEKLIQEIIINL